MNIPTIKVKAASAEQGEFIVINESDFDAETHEIYVQPDEETQKKKKQVEKE